MITSCVDFGQSSSTRRSLSSQSRRPQQHRNLLCGCLPWSFGSSNINISSNNGNRRNRNEMVRLGQAVDVIVVVHDDDDNSNDNVQDDENKNRDGSANVLKDRLMITCSNFNAQFTGFYDQEIARISLVVQFGDDDEYVLDALDEIEINDCPMVLEHGWVKFLHELDDHDDDDDDRTHPNYQYKQPQQSSTNTKPSASALSKLVQQVQHRRQQLPQRRRRRRRRNDTTPGQQQYQQPPKTSFTMRYLLYDVHNSLVGEARANLFLWKSTYKIVICDIDGTITRSNLQGVFDTILTENYKKYHPTSTTTAANSDETYYSSCHDGICQFLSQLVAKNDDGSKDHELVQVVYLTARPIALATITRSFLQHVRQPPSAKAVKSNQVALPSTTTHPSESSYSLPHGPLLMFLGSMSQMLFMELVTRTVHDVKAQLLWDNVVEPFQPPWPMQNESFCDTDNSANGRTSRTDGSRRGQFVAGFGNSLSDAMAYHMVGVPLGHIFMLHPSSRIGCFPELEGLDDALENVHLPETQPLVVMTTPAAPSASVTTTTTRREIVGGGAGDLSVVASRDMTMMPSLPPTNSARSMLSNNSSGGSMTSVGSSGSHGPRRLPLRPMEWYQQKLTIMFHSFHDEQLHARVKEERASIS